MVVGDVCSIETKLLKASKGTEDENAVINEQLKVKHGMTRPATTLAYENE